MADILDMLGFSQEALAQKAQKARDEAQQYMQTAMSPTPGYEFNAPEEPTAPAREDIDPNIPNKSSKEDIAGADYSKFFGNLPPIKAPDEKFAEYKKQAESNGEMMDPRTMGPLNPGIDFSTGLPKPQNEAFENALLSGFKANQSADQARYADTGNQFDPEALVKYQQLVEKYKALGLTPPPMPAGLAEMAKANELPGLGQLTPPEKTNEPAQGEAGGGASSKLSISGHVPGAGAVGGSTAASKGQTLDDFIKSMSGDSAALKEAQGARDKSQMIANLSSAGNIVGAALSRGAIKPDLTVQENMLKQANQPIENILQQQALQKGKLEVSKLAADVFDDKQRRDANSPLSAAYRNLAKTLTPEIARSPGFDAMSADEVTKAQPMIDSVYKSNMMKLMMEERAKAKFTLDSGKAKSEMGKTIQTVLNRATPAQATLGILAADKIMDLFKNKPNPSDWDASEVHLFRTETEKLAKGGIPSERGTAAIIPPTVYSMLTKVGSAVSGNSIGTGQGETIKNLIPYIQNVRNTSAEYIRKQVYNPVLNSFNKRLTPEDLEDYKRSVPSYIYPELSPAAPQTVRVQLPDGQIGTVPRENLKDIMAAHPGTKEL